MPATEYKTMSGKTSGTRVMSEHSTIVATPNTLFLLEFLFILLLL
jgi:hypothetical protein